MEISSQSAQHNSTEPGHKEIAASNVCQCQQKLFASNVVQLEIPVNDLAIFGLTFLLPGTHTLPHAPLLLWMLNAAGILTRCILIKNKPVTSQMLPINQHKAENWHQTNVNLSKRQHKHRLTEARCQIQCM